VLSVVLVIPDQDPDLHVIPDGIRVQDHVHIHLELAVVVVEEDLAMEVVQDPLEESVDEVIADHRCPIVDDTLEAAMHLKVPIVLVSLG